MKLPKAAKKIVAIDLDGEFLRLMAANIFKQRAQIQIMTQVPIPSDVMAGQRLVQSVWLSQTLASLRSQLHLTDSEMVITSIPDAFVINKTITLSQKLSVLEIENYLALTGEEYLDHPMAELYYDFIKIAPNLMIVAAKRSEIDKRLAAMMAVNFATEIVDVDSRVIARYMHLTAECQTKIWLNQQRQVIQFLLIHCSGEVIAKTEKNIEFLQEREVAEKIIAEINFLKNNFCPNQDVAVYCGPKISETGLIQLLQSGIELKPIASLVPSCFAIAKNADPSGFEKCFGLIAWFFTDQNVPKLNLMPWRLKEYRSKRKNLAAWFGLNICIVILIMLVANYVLVMGDNTLQSKINNIHEKLKTMPRQPIASQNNNQIYSKQISKMNQFLQTLPAIISPLAELKVIRFDKSILSLQGQAKEAGNVLVIVEQLRRKTGCLEPKLSNFERIGTKYDFTIECSF